MSNSTMKDQPRHAIRIAAQRSGIPTDTLRAWERRHRVVTPARSDSARRLYSDADIEHLRLLHELVERGHSIGHIASLAPDQLAALLTSEIPATGSRPGSPASDAAEAAARAEAQRALLDMDGHALRRVVRRAMVDLETDRVIESVLAPLCRSIGDQWATGAICTAHEHIASVALRDALGSMLDVLQPARRGPRLVAATPAGERHELGALMAATVAASAGWEVTYLGPDLPASDIAAVARQLGARAVLLSIVRRPAADDAAMPEVRALRASLDPGTALFVGGAGAARLAEQVTAAGATQIDDLTALRQALADRGGE
jgi:methanogenic corrinoid protein MtbC1